MSESELAVIKPEALKTYIWLQCFDGSIQQVEEEVAMFCPMICREIVKNGTGSSKNHAIVLPERVNPASLSLILDYCRFHQVPGRSNKERKSFDEKFVRIDTEKLCKLASAALGLQLRPLVDLTCGALARIIGGKTPDEVRDIFHLPDDLTEEEKLEPLKNINDDPTIRLLNRLYAKKRKELQERQKLKDVQTQEEQKDERSLDELLCFINGDGGSRGGKAAKSKKKNKRRKDQAKNPARANSEPVNKVRATVLLFFLWGVTLYRMVCFLHNFFWELRRELAVWFRAKQIVVIFLSFLAKVKICKMISSTPLMMLILMMDLILQ
ncbi:hypothetical protein SEVIR_6G024700v4 [Setaria viridis]